MAKLVLTNLIVEKIAIEMKHISINNKCIFKYVGKNLFSSTFFFCKVQVLEVK